METLLELDDIQGNIVKAYGRFGFPKARFIFYRVNRGRVGRQFVLQLAPWITTSARWKDKSQIPPVATNIAFTYQGLKHLRVPSATLHGFPDEFAMGIDSVFSTIPDCIVAPLVGRYRFAQVIHAGFHIESGAYARQGHPQFHQCDGHRRLHPHHHRLRIQHPGHRRDIGQRAPDK